MKVFRRGMAALRCVGWLAIAGLAVCFAINVPDCAAGEGDTQLVHLYFADAKRPFLIAESRVMVDPGDPTAFCRQLVLELINGSARGNLATIPKGTQLRSFFSAWRWDGGGGFFHASKEKLPRELPTGTIDRIFGGQFTDSQRFRD
jgi:hypothetical protein